MAITGVRNILASMFLLVVAFSATASSPDAWNDLYRNTGTACLKSSGLKHAKLIGEPVTFRQAILYRINGIWPQAHMKGKKAKLYCLHPYPEGEPEIVTRH